MTIGLDEEKIRKYAKYQEDQERKEEQQGKWELSYILFYFALY